TPVEPIDALSGFSLSQPISSLRLFAGRSFFPRNSSGASASSAIGSKSLTTSYCSAYVIPLATCVFQMPTVIVYPSGAARATRPVPMLPVAPPTFSMMMVWPSAVRMPSAIRRPTTSVSPPGGNGTIIVIGRHGYACAKAKRDATGSAAAPAARCRNCLRWGSFIMNLPILTLFDHLVGQREQRRRYRDVEQPGGLVIDHKLELAGLHHRQVRGLCALEHAAGVEPKLAPRLVQVGSVAHEPADFRILTSHIGRRQRVPCGQLNKLDAPAGKKGAAANKQNVRPLARQGGEGGINRATGVGFENPNFPPDGTRSRLHVPQHSFRIRGISRIDDQGNMSDSWHQFAQELDPLGHQLGGDKVDACQIAVRPREAGDETKPDRIVGDGKDNWDRRGCSLGR